MCVCESASEERDDVSLCERVCVCVCKHSCMLLNTLGMVGEHQHIFIYNV